MSEGVDWVNEYLKDLDPFVDLNYIYSTGVVNAPKRLSQLIREVGWKQASEHPEVERIANWIYEHGADPN